MSCRARLEQELRVDISGELVVAEYRRLYPQYSASDVFFAATTAGRSWRAAIVEAELRARRVRLPTPTSSTGARPRTAANGAPSTRSTSR